MMSEVVGESRLIQLKELKRVLADAIDNTSSGRDLAQLTKQYREVLAEIEEIEGGDEDDEIGALLSERRAEGKPTSIR